MKSLVSIALSLLAGSCVCLAADGPELAVIVNKARVPATADLSELREMILGERPKWRDGQPVVTVQPPQDSPERALALKTLYKMNDAALRRYYLLAVFAGKEISMPKEVPSVAAVKKFVANNPGAIGYVLASEVDDSVKVLKVDGANPGEPGYKLR